MDNEKIGKFITKLRKAKNLTQQQLGDLVGVGGKSVSKWERGLNMPDISIINQVSKVLGITSDELLKGEFSKNSINEEYRKKRNQRRYRLFLILLLILTVVITTLLVFKFRNVTHKYWISSADDSFSVEGSIEFDKEGYSLNISKIYCKLDECKVNNINYIKYYLLFGDKLIYKNETDSDVITNVSIDNYMADKVIYISDRFTNNILSYSDIEKEISNMIMSIETNDINDNFYDYKFNLKITDIST